MKENRTFPKWTFLFISALSLFFIPTFSFGATFCVSNATGLQSALTTAKSNGEDNTIKIVQGTYNGNFIYAPTEAYGLTVGVGTQAYTVCYLGHRGKPVISSFGGADRKLCYVHG